MELDYCRSWLGKNYSRHEKKCHGDHQNFLTLSQIVS